MANTINKTQTSGKKDKETKHYTLKTTSKTNSNWNKRFFKADTDGAETICSDRVPNTDDTF